MRPIDWINLGLLIVAIAGGVWYLGQLDGRVNALQPEKIRKAEEEAVRRINQLSQPPILDHKVYKWKQGKPEVEMLGETEGYCYLVYVTGKFEGGGEAVSIYVKGKSWYLGGRSHQIDVEAHARCWKWPNSLRN